MTKLGSKIKAIFSKDSFARNVTMLASGTAMGQAIAFIASPLLTRLYIPENFGYLAIYTSVLSTLVVIGSLRYQLAIPLPEKDEDGFALLSLSCLILVTITTLLSLGLLLWKEPLFTFLNAESLQKFWWLIPLGLFGAGLYQALSYWSIRKQAYRNLSLTKLTQGISLVGVQIGLGFFKLGELGLIIGDIAGRTAGSSNLARLSLKGNVWQELSVERIKQNLIRYRRFPLLSSVSALFNSAGLQLPSLLLLAFYGPQVAGWFALSQRVLGIPTTLLGTSVSQVYTGKAAQMARETPTSLLPLFQKTVSRLFLLALLPAIVLSIFAPQLSAFVFGQDWYRTGQYIQVLTPMFLAQLAVSPLSQTLIILERQDLQLIWDISRFLLVVGVLWLAKFAHFSDFEGIIIFSVSNFIAYAALLGFNVLALKQMKHD
jgi:O-antigen/teichoic acid export membrane protein